VVRLLVLQAAEHDVTMTSANQVNPALHLLANCNCAYSVLTVCKLNWLVMSVLQLRLMSLIY